MVHEFAVDPELVVTWAKDINCRRFYEGEFRLGQGRRISNYPSKQDKWFRLIQEAFNKKFGESGADIPRHKMKELLIRWRKGGIPDRRRGWTSPVVDHPHSPYDENQTWLENARQEKDRRSFRAIISTTNPTKDKRVLLDAGERPEYSDRLWETETSKSVERKCDKLAKAVTGFLRISTHVIFVDPHMKLINRYQDALEAYFRVFKENEHCGPKLERVELVFRDSKEGQTKAEWEDYVPSLMENLPPGTSLTVTCYRGRWISESEQIFHNRWILSEQGGIGFKFGLDVGDGMESMNLIEPPEWHELWNAYQKPPPNLSFVVEDTKR